MFVVAAVLGRLVIWSLMTSGPTKRIWRLHPLLRELGECDFCLGFWVYLAFVIPLRLNVLAPWYIPVLSEVATALAFSFVAHLVRLGWGVKFGLMLTEED